MENKNLNKVIELLIRVPPVVHRKLHRKVLYAALEQTGIDFALHHLLIMKLLRETGTMNNTEIGEIIGIAKAQMTHSIDRLVDLELVERQADKQDRRKIHIKLTQKGNQILQKLDRIIERDMKTKLAILNEDELRKLADAFQYITDTFSKLQ